MTQLSVMELAKQGDPNAIAALINRSLTSKGIHASAELESPQCLKISLQASQVPSQKAIVTIIHRGMMVLQIEQLKSVKIFTYCSDNNYLAWRYEIILNNNFDESLPNPQIVKSADSDQARTTPDQSMNLVKNSSGVLLVQKLSQIQQNLQEYQDVIVRFTDEQMGHVRCLTTLTELIQVISKPSFLFTTVASNPNLRSLLDTIAESSKTDEHGDQVITNLSILQPGQQWQKAQIRLVSKIFLEPAEDEQPHDRKHQGLTLDLIESQPEEIKSEEIKKKFVSYDNSLVLDNEVSQEGYANSNKSSEPEIITTDSLFDEFDSFPSSTSSTSPSSTSIIIDQQINDQMTDDVTSSDVTEIADWSKSSSVTVNSLFDQVTDDVTSSAVTEIADWAKSSSVTVNSLFDDFPDTENTDDVTVRLVDDETILLDEDQDLFNNFGFGQRSPDVSSSSSSSIKISETEEDVEAIKSRISKQNLDQLLSLIEQEDQTNTETNEQSTLVTLEDFWGD